MQLAQNIRDVFGEIAPDRAPGAEGLGFFRFGSGATGIGNFLSALVVLIYTIAAVVFLFMILWGAFEWLTSGGDKERVEAARNRLTHAFIGIVLFGIAFAILAVLGRFLGFSFFSLPGA